MALKKKTVKALSPVIQPASPAKTQKAKGIAVLKAHGIHGLSTDAIKEARIFPHEPRPAFPFFGRPCPLVPRHGFVESRVIETEEQWTALLAEIEATKEPVIEVVCMPFITPTFSGILTPGLLSYGPGHDGATSGKGAKAIPTPCASREQFLSIFGLRQTAKLAGITEAPYIEFVATEDAVQAVQLRNGPDVNGIEWIPEDLTPQQVIEVQPDMPLLIWEELMKNLKGQPGVVIWHPGGTMASHFAVQARAANIPITCRPTKPEVGKVLPKSKDAPAGLTKADYHLLAKLVAQAMQHQRMGVDNEEEMRLGIAALHAQALWGPERHLLVLRAVALTAMMRYGAAALLGELRHWGCHGPGRVNKSAQRKTDLGGINALTCNCSRTQVYQVAFKQRSQDLAERLGPAFEDYMHPGWPGSYGGKNWANCTKAVAELYRRTAEFLVQRNEASWAEVVGGWNLVVNAIHNNGNLLNKFIGKPEMDRLAVVPAWGLVSQLVGRLTLASETYKPHYMPAWVGSILKPRFPDMKPKHKPVVLPASIECRWQVREKQLYLQLALPGVEVTKPYGHAHYYALSADLVTLLEALPRTGESLAGTGTPYATGTVTAVNGVLVLTTGDGLTQVALERAEALEQLIQKAQAGKQEFEFVYPS